MSVVLHITGYPDLDFKSEITGEDAIFEAQQNYRLAYGGIHRNGTTIARKNVLEDGEYDFVNFQILEPPPKKITKRVKTVQLKDFTVPISECKNLNGHEATTMKHLVDLQRVIQESQMVVANQMHIEPDGCGRFRRHPLVFSRLSRGGKTTVLTTLFNELKKQGYLVIIISFNSQSGFVRRSNDRPEEVILRQIVMQLIDQSAYTKDDFECDEATVDEYLRQQSKYGSSSQQRVILLVDELNILGVPLSSAASAMLQRLFLQKNRYLIFSTQIPFILSSINDETLSPFDKKQVITFTSLTELKVVRMPHCNDLHELRQMENCMALTGHVATIYGGIPSLIYCGVKNPNFHRGRFYQVMTKKFAGLFPEFETNKELRKSVLEKFVNEVLHGSAMHGSPELRFFDQFSTIPENDKIRWPLCYLSQILCYLAGTKGSGGSIAQQIDYISNSEVPVFAAIAAEIGLDWQSVVDVAVLLRALGALLFEEKHPLVTTRTKIESIEFVTMPEEIQTLEDAKTFILELCEEYNPDSLIVIRSSYAKFPLFDGFVVVKISEHKIEINGYQVKLGRRTPAQDIPDWMRKGYLIRGLAESTASVRPNGWTYFNQTEIEEFLGYSLASLYPACWNTALSPEQMFD